MAECSIRKNTQELATVNSLHAALVPVAQPDQASIVHAGSVEEFLQRVSSLHVVTKNPCSILFNGFLAHRRRKENI